MVALAAVNEFPKRLQSNFVRDNAWEIARLASCGLITTAITLNCGEAVYGHFWRCTWKGLRVLELGDAS